MFPDRILVGDMELPARTASCPVEKWVCQWKKLDTGTQARRGIEPRQISSQPCLLSSHWTIYDPDDGQKHIQSCAHWKKADLLVPGSAGVCLLIGLCPDQWNVKPSPFRGSNSGLAVWVSGCLSLRRLGRCCFCSVALPTRSCSTWALMSGTLC